MYLLSTVSMFMAVYSTWQLLILLSLETREIEVVCHVAALIPRGISLCQYVLCIVQIVCERHASSPNITT